MLATLKSEFRKLYTVRSTYVILAIILLLVGFFAFYINGWRSSASNLHDPLVLSSIATGAVNDVADFAGLIAILLMTQEYRYNLIAYTLTASNNRSKVLAAKVLVVTLFAIALTCFIGWLAPAAAVWGASLHGLHFVPQIINYHTLIWHSLFFEWGYAMAALILATIIRNQIGAIVALFIGPGVVEGLLSLLFKNNSVYLPFTALTVVLGQTLNPQYQHIISPLKAVGVVSIYLVIGGAVAWTLFLRRDATS
jgi:ABC-type transport system involved in multi-copper enzyme maturation permease subunit